MDELIIVGIISAGLAIIFCWAFYPKISGVFMAAVTVPFFLYAYHLHMEEERKYETFESPLYKIETHGAISGSHWRAFGLGHGEVNGEAHYYAKTYKVLADNSIQFHTIEGDLVRCTHYKISRFNATFKRKTKYNQVFLLDPDDRHFIKVCSSHE